jgi:hypothetical protein
MFDGLFVAAGEACVRLRSSRESGNAVCQEDWMLRFTTGDISGTKKTPRTSRGVFQYSETAGITYQPSA